jgi:hypothetical protein
MKWIAGHFHGWGFESPEPQTMNSVAIVEDEESGAIRKIGVELVTFRSIPPNGPPKFHA